MPGHPRSECLRASLLAGWVVLLASPAPASAQTCIDATDDVAVWYGGDDNADDLIGVQHGARFNGAAYTDAVVGRGFSFDGIDDAIENDVDPGEQALVANDFTIELWANPLASRLAVPESATGIGAQIGQRFALFPQSGGAVAAGIGLSIGSNGVSVVEHGDAHFTATLVHDDALASWTHVALVVDDRTPRLFLDGVLVRSGTQSARAQVFPSWRDLGTDRDSPLHIGYGAYQGGLDEVTVHDRALDAAQIAAIFAAGADGKCKPLCAIGFPGANDDLWDVTQGSVVTANSGMQESAPGSGIVVSSVDDAFGATDTAGDPGVATFRDDAPVGTVHSIDWRTPVPVLAGEFQMHAVHESTNGNQRAFDRVRLLGREFGSGQMLTLYESQMPIPFPIDGIDGARVERCVGLRPRLVQEFRIEFTQAGAMAGASNGPQLFELNAYGAVISELFRDGFE
jgi:hypothetical protein